MACRILVVEDDLDVQESIRQLLELDGFNVVAAANGQEALDRLKEGDACLVLLDLMMPIMSGWQFLEARSTDTMLASVPVLVVSATNEPVQEKGAIAGRIRKPVDADALLEICHAYCDRDKCAA
jgi:CheY-like chemotaxis protein